MTTNLRIGCQTKVVHIEDHILCGHQHVFNCVMVYDLFPEGKFKGASGSAGKGKGVKRKRPQSFKPPPLAVMQGNDDALLDAGFEGRM